MEGAAQMDVPPKRGRGRPPGAKNKPKVECTAPTEPVVMKRVKRVKLKAPSEV